MLADRMRDAAELLAWYAEMGVTEALDDEPHDHFAAPEPAAAAPARPERGPAAPSLALSPIEEATATARALAAAATSLNALREAMAQFEGCSLKATAKSLCFADGNPQGRLMLVGEAPGADEDCAGLPFVGRSGQLLDRMLAAIGLSREADVYIANLLPWRPPGNRTPTPQEVATCLPFIQRQIALCNPQVLVCVGGPSSQALLGLTSITRSRGNWLEYDTGTRRIPALAMLHPAFLLRQPIQKRHAWRDLRQIQAKLDSLPPRPGR